MTWRALAWGMSVPDTWPESKRLRRDSWKVKTRPGATSSLLTIGLGFKGDLTGRDNAMLSATANS
jgi:ABC-type polysaccharide/polyol phosphate transport system ATPase subunit